MCAQESAHHRRRLRLPHDTRPRVLEEPPRPQRAHSHNIQSAPQQRDGRRRAPAYDGAVSAWDNTASRGAHPHSASALPLTSSPAPARDIAVHEYPPVQGGSAAPACAGVSGFSHSVRRAIHASVRVLRRCGGTLWALRERRTRQQTLATTPRGLDFGERDAPLSARAAVGGPLICTCWGARRRAAPVLPALRRSRPQTHIRRPLGGVGARTKRPLVVPIAESIPSLRRRRAARRGSAMPVSADARGDGRRTVCWALSVCTRLMPRAPAVDLSRRFRRRAFVPPCWLQRNAMRGPGGGAQ